MTPVQAMVQSAARTVGKYGGAAADSWGAGEFDGRRESGKAGSAVV